MKINDPDFYFHKKIRVYSPNGIITAGELYGYDYDYDDNGKEFLEFDIERDDGFLISYTDD